MDSKLRASSMNMSQNRKHISIYAREPNTVSTPLMKRRFLPRVCCSPGGWCHSSRHVAEKPAGQNILFPWGAVSCWAPKKGEKGRKRAKKLWIPVYLHNFFWNFEIRILAVNPYSISKSYAYVAETPTRVCLTFCSSGNLLAFKTLMSPIKIKPQNIWRKKKTKTPIR